MKAKEMKFVEFIMLILENKVWRVIMRYVEMTTDEAIEMLQKAKGQKVLVAIQDLKTDEPVLFYPQTKSDCLLMIKEAETISSACDDFVRQLRLFSEKQRDLMNIVPEGLQRTILLKS